MPSLKTRKAPANGWYKDKSGTWRRLLARDGWYKTKTGKWKNRKPTLWYKDTAGIWRKRDPKLGWYRDKRGRWHQLRKADGWYRGKDGKWRNTRPSLWAKDTNGVWRKRKGATTLPAETPKGIAATPTASPTGPTGSTGSPAADPVLSAGPPPRYDGPFGAAQAERLLWRAGFGGPIAEAERLAAMGLDAAVRSFTRVSGTANLVGPAPSRALDPENNISHAVDWWMDRMIRSDQPLVERMTLILHDWIPSSHDGIDSARFMMKQNHLLRSHALGSFRSLVHDITADTAMLIYLDGQHNHRNGHNNNYAREVMELFALGADRGAYVEEDVIQMARALSGWLRVTYDPDVVTPHEWRTFEWEDGPKTIFGRTGNFTPTEALELVLTHPLHSSFFVEKLWGYFIPTPPDAGTLLSLRRVYLDSGLQILPVLEAILSHPAFYTGEVMVAPPIVHIAGLHRMIGDGLEVGVWNAINELTGMKILYPPNVAGWSEDWLATNTLRGRWIAAAQVLVPHVFPMSGPYPYGETPQQAVEKAITFWGNPTLTPATRQTLLDFATTCQSVARGWGEVSTYTSRQNALRQLIAVSPDLLTI